MVPESIRSAWISTLGQHQGSSSGRTRRQTPVSAAEASQDRRTRETSKTLLASRWRLSWRMARWGRFTFRDCGPSHILVFAPTQSGKGVGIVIPTLLTWPHSVIVHDLKGENWALTAGARKRMGQICLKYEPASPESGLARFNPLAEVRLRTPYEMRDVQQHRADDHGPERQRASRPLVARRLGGIRGFILHRLYEGREPTLERHRQPAFRSGTESRSTRPRAADARRT